MWGPFPFSTSGSIGKADCFAAKSFQSRKKHAMMENAKFLQSSSPFVSTHVTTAEQMRSFRTGQQLLPPLTPVPLSPPHTQTKTTTHRIRPPQRQQQPQPRAPRNGTPPYSTSPRSTQTAGVLFTEIISLHHCLDCRTCHSRQLLRAHFFTPHNRSISIAISSFQSQYCCFAAMHHFLTTGALLHRLRRRHLPYPLQKLFCSELSPPEPKPCRRRWRHRHDHDVSYHKQLLCSRSTKTSHAQSERTAQRTKHKCEHSLNKRKVTRPENILRLKVRRYGMHCRCHKFGGTSKRINVQ